MVASLRRAAMKRDIVYSSQRRRLMPLTRALGVAVGLLVGLSACGGDVSQPPRVVRPVRVVAITLSADTGFPGPSWTFVRLRRGEKGFPRVVRLLPRPLPAPVTKPRTGITICLPARLTIRSSDGRRFVYRACQRPPTMRPLLRALCPLLGRRRFCARYHRLLVKRGRHIRRL
jgi:hypothetical protein